MKISSRLSINFSIITSSVFIAFGLIVYFFSSYHNQLDFQERLKGRIEITEKIFLEKESFSPLEFEKITNQFLHTLPEETEEVVEIISGITPEFEYGYPSDILHDLVENEIFEFTDSEVLGRSKIFHVKGKKYLIIVTAVDTIGMQYLTYLRNLVIFLVFLGVPLIFAGSFILTQRALLPLSKKIDKANSIGASNLHDRLIVYNPKDEIGKLAIAFNNLLERLEASFEAQKAFIRNASHEIRNPLTAIMGEAEIALSKARTNQEYLESLKVILAEAETLNLTVTNLLQLSKVAADEGSINFKPIPFAEFLFALKRSFDFSNPENQMEIAEVALDQNGNWGVSGNENLLKTAILNLFDNACKFSSNAKVQVVLSQDSNTLKLSIQDTGIGIAARDIDKIMTPFYRGENAIKIKGSGIGLALSSKIISLHQGSLEVHSEIEIGTKVVLKLPLLSG